MATPTTTTGELYRQYTAVLEHEQEIRGRDRIMAAGVGGIFTALFMTPFDVVKIRLQVQRKPLTPGEKFVVRDGILDHICTCNGGNHAPSNDNCEINIRKIAWYKRPGHFNGTFDAFKKIVKYEGVGSLWSGLYPTIFMSLPTVAVYYPTYDYLKDKLGYDKNAGDQVLIPMAASGSARAVASVLFCPAEMIRTKMQSEKMASSRVLQCVRSQISNYGFSSLFLGLTPSLMRDVPFSMIYWCILEQIRHRLARKFNKRETSLPISVISGSIGGGIAAIVTLPFDVVKTQAQIQLGSENFVTGKTLPIHKTLHSIWVKDGLQGLFAGFTPRLLRIMPACAIMLSTYELLKRFLSS